MFVVLPGGGTPKRGYDCTETGAPRTEHDDLASDYDDDLASDYHDDRAVGLDRRQSASLRDRG
jgi:hypothetical protein